MPMQGDIGELAKLRAKLGKVKRAYRRIAKEAAGPALEAVLAELATLPRAGATLPHATTLQVKGAKLRIRSAARVSKQRVRAAVIPPIEAAAQKVLTALLEENQ
jgi:hypothetical protein